jgi:MoaA/NifB/PqqE/SkfB family radical SAM enzyme
VSAKLCCRTLRNAVFRKRPYFAHLALTNTCNLRCSFCHIWEERLPELDTEAMKRVIDQLDRMGIAILSFTGGEPLLRSDCVPLVDYAAAKGLETIVASNGTMPKAKYSELLASRVGQITVSLDGVRGSILPYGHVGPGIIDSIRYLNDHLPKGMRLMLNVTVTSRNCSQVDEIVDYCAREFHRARVWLNPVMVGRGKLRVTTESKANPDYLRRVDSPTLLTPGYFKQGAEDYYRNEIYDWGCLAGEMFFDIKPNGDLWICQDFPAKTPLNVLDPDFEEKYRRADFSNRRECSGCLYSCHWGTQKAFEPKNWPGIAGMWWKWSTEIDEPCRQTTQRYGWVAGLAHYCGSHLLQAAQQKARALMGTPTASPVPASRNLAKELR